MDKTLTPSPWTTHPRRPRVDKMSVVKVYCKIEKSPWALTLTEPVPEAFELPASDWPQKIFLMLSKPEKLQAL